MTCSLGTSLSLIRRSREGSHPITRSAWGPRLISRLLAVPLRLVALMRASPEGTRIPEQERARHRSRQIIRESFTHP